MAKNKNVSSETISNFVGGKVPVIKGRKKIEKTAFNEIVIMDNPGDTFSGKLIELRETQTKFGVGEIADFVDIETGETKGLFITSNLKGFNLGDKLGMWLCVTFDSWERNPKSKQLYKSFSVEELDVEE